MRLTFALLSLLVLASCADPLAQTVIEPPPAAPPYSPGAHHWVIDKHGDDPYHARWICDADGRGDDGEVVRYKYIEAGYYNAYLRGTDYGSFETAEQAKAQVERMFSLNHFKCN